LHPEYDYMRTYIEPCEAGGKYSSYLNVNSDYFPCSFTEGNDEWKNGLNVRDCDDFMKDIWFNKKTQNFGNTVEKCRKCNIGCPIYEI
jgi:radical SAM protein with 4Fe4S-binding SPASM domain